MHSTQKYIDKLKRRTRRTVRVMRQQYKMQYIIFDLDGTLVNVDWKNKPPLPAPVKLPSHLITTNSFIDSKGQQMKYPMYLRPGTKQLLNYLLNNPKRYKVGIWSASFKNYTVGIVNQLFGKKYANKLFCLLGTDEVPDNNTGLPTRVIENILTSKYLPSRIVDKKVVKDLTTLFKEYPELNAGNTLLIDDLELHKHENPAQTNGCIYSIPEWNPYHQVADNELIKLLILAKQNKLLSLGTK